MDTAGNFQQNLRQVEWIVSKTLIRETYKEKKEIYIQFIPGLVISTCLFFF